MRNTFHIIEQLKKMRSSFLKMFPKLFSESAEFYNWYNFIESSQYWPEEKIKEYQWEKISSLIRFCYQNVPYYKDLFQKLQLTPESIRNFDDFKKIPFTTKEIVRKHGAAFVPVNINRSTLSLHSTSGSTGEPLGIYSSSDLATIEFAFMFHQWSRVGYQPKDLVVRVRGEELPEGKLWIYDHGTNAYVFSSYQLKPENIQAYAEQINKVQPKFLHVYPSSLWLLISLFEQHNIKLKISPKAIFCGSEKLFEYQRNKFESFFKCRVYSWLGMGEQSVLAGECEVSNNYHAFPQYSYVELIDDNGMDIAESNVQGEIVGTNLFNYTMPLLRYRTKDIGIWKNGECGCNRHWKIFSSIEGRKQEFIVTNKGEKFPIGPAIFGIHEEFFTGIRRLQFVQNEMGVLLLKIELVNNDLANTNAMVDRIYSVFDKRFKNSFKFRIITTNQFELTANGKHKFLVQNIPL